MALQQRKLLSGLMCAIEPGECVMLHYLVRNYFFYCAWYCWSNVPATVHFCAVYFKVGFFDALLPKNVTFHNALNMLPLHL
jgi:hypothetical protein